jgi:cell division transport system ATP-binding protein
MIRFEEVSKRYARSGDALAGVSFALAEGEMAFLTGHSGAGKSTLLRLIGLVERPSRGRVEVAGRDLGRLRRRQIPQHRRQVGMIFQDFKLLQDRTVFDNVALPLIVAGVPVGEIGKRSRAALDKVGLLRKERVLPQELSAGEQQRVGIARAIVTRPPVVVADEPTGNLDPELSWEIMDLFGQLNRVGVTLLIATHDVDLVRRMHYRTLTLRHGHLVDDTGPPRP